MTKTARILTSALGLTALLLTSAHAETPYGVVKLGAFLPNGKGDTQITDEGGLKDFDTGFNVEAAVGFYVAPYAAFEFGSGYYRSERNDDTPAGNKKYTLGTIPVTATAKFIVANDPFEFGIGAGAGCDKNSALNGFNRVLLFIVQVPFIDAIARTLGEPLEKIHLYTLVVYLMPT